MDWSYWSQWVQQRSAMLQEAATPGAGTPEEPGIISEWWPGALVVLVVFLTWGWWHTSRQNRSSGGDR